MTKYVTHKPVTMMIRIASEFVIAGSRTKALTMEAPVPNHVTPMTDLILARVTMTGYFMGKTTQTPIHADEKRDAHGSRIEHEREHYGRVVQSVWVWRAVITDCRYNK